MQRLIRVKLQPPIAFCIVNDRMSNELSGPKNHAAGQQSHGPAMDQCVSGKALIPRPSGDWVFVVLSPRQEVALKRVIAKGMANYQ